MPTLTIFGDFSKKHKGPPLSPKNQSEKSKNFDVKNFEVSETPNFRPKEVSEMAIF